MFWPSRDGHFAVAIFSSLSLQELQRVPEPGCRALSWHPRGPSLAVHLVRGSSAAIFIYTNVCAAEVNEGLQLRCAHQIQLDDLSLTVGMCLFSGHLILGGYALKYLYHATSLHVVVVRFESRREFRPLTVLAFVPRSNVYSLVFLFLSLCVRPYFQLICPSIRSSISLFRNLSLRKYCGSDDPCSQGWLCPHGTVHLATFCLGGQHQIFCCGWPPLSVISEAGGFGTSKEASSEVMVDSEIHPPTEELTVSRCLYVAYIFRTRSGSRVGRAKRSRSDGVIGAASEF